MKQSWLLLLGVWAFYAVYLCSPSFVHSSNAKGGYSYMQGWQHTWFFGGLLTCVLKLNEAETMTFLFVALPMLLAETGFIVLPFLHFKKIFRHRWPQFFLAGVFVAGGISFGWLVRYDIKMEYGVGRGVYFWLAAAVCALIYCLLSAVSLERQAGKAILKN